MAILNKSDLVKTIKRTSLQRDLLVLSPLFNEAEKEELTGIYSNLLRIYRKSLKLHDQLEKAREIKVVKPEILK